MQLQNTRLAISRLFGTILNEIKGFKCVETLKVTFVKKKDDDIDKTAYFNSRARIVINPNDFLPSLQLSQQQILNGIGVWLSEGSGWTISSIDEPYIIYQYSSVSTHKSKVAHIYPCQQSSKILQRVWLTLRMKIMRVFVGAIFGI